MFGPPFDSYPQRRDQGGCAHPKVQRVWLPRYRAYRSRVPSVECPLLGGLPDVMSATGACPEGEVMLARSPPGRRASRYGHCALPTANPPTAGLRSSLLEPVIGAQSSIKRRKRVVDTPQKERSEVVRYHWTGVGVNRRMPKPNDSFDRHLVSMAC